MKVWKKMRENWNLRKMEKLRQKELDRQRQEEAERFQKIQHNLRLYGRNANAEKPL